MEFRTNRLTVHPMSLADKEDILDLVTNEIVSKTYMFPAFENRAAAEPLLQRLVKLCEDESRYVAGVYLGERFIGMMNGVDIKDKQIEMGYAYLPAYYNQGFATEAFAGAIDYLLAHGFETVLAGAFEENPASIRVMEKCGMEKISFTEEIEYRGKIHNCVYYAITK